MSAPRGRYAPSPTGHMTVGNAYTAIRAWLDVRSRGGTFILRIDDTDPARAAVSAGDIVSELQLVGLDWDEGPDVGGPHGPHVASERRSRHHEVAEQLVESGHAYWDYGAPIGDVATHKQAREREKAGRTAYRGSAEPVAGIDPVLRLGVLTDEVRVTDRVFGELRVSGEDIAEVALLRGDGRPTYHLASTVDDIDMCMTTVVRGADWLNYLPQHVLLFEALDADLPEFAHVPLLLGSDGQKLSKRHGDLSIRHLVGEEGLPSEAVCSYLANLGFEERSDVRTLAELATDFDIEDMRRAPPRFDPKKLKTFARRWMADREPEDRLLREILARAEIPELTPGQARALVAGVRSRVASATEAADLAAFLGVHDRPGRDPELVSDDIAERILAAEPWDAATLEGIVAELFPAGSEYRKEHLSGLRDALAPGFKVTLPLHFLLAALGRDRSCVRLGSTG